MNKKSNNTSWSKIKTISPIIISLFALIISGISFKYTYNNDKDLKLIKVESLLNEAKDYLGTGEGTHSLIVGELSSNKELELSRRKIQEALTIDKENCRGFRLLGYYYHKKKDYDNAILAYKQAQRIHPLEAELTSLEGFSLWKKGLVDDAISKYKEALDKDQNCLSAHDDLSVIYFTQNRFNDALIHAKKINEIQPNNYIFKWQLATTYLKLNEVEKGVELCNQLILMDSTNNIAYELLSSFNLLN